MPIDLRSDTVTRPTPAMRRAMADADVGDDDRDGDPTTGRLEARVAELLGKEAALFVPSGIMGNQIAVWLQSRPGTEILLDAGAHIVHYEAAAAAGLSGAQLRLVVGAGPIMDAAALKATLRPPSKDAPRASLVCVENTHNGAGGMITPLAELRAIREVARSRELPVHLDGARLWNASVASGTPPADFAACGDTVMVDFSKGLGCPIGGAIAGTRALMEEAWTVRKRFGGSLRQSGILTAAALFAFDHQYDRLAEDHVHAADFAKRVDGAGGAKVVRPDTNIVMIDLPAGRNTPEVAKGLLAEGVLVSQWSPTRIRCVFHLDVSGADVTRAAGIVTRALEGKAA